jgi:hypothetical protein
VKSNEINFRAAKRSSMASSRMASTPVFGLPGAQIYGLFDAFIRRS